MDQPLVCVGAAASIVADLDITAAIARLSVLGALLRAALLRCEQWSKPTPWLLR